MMMMMKKDICPQKYLPSRAPSALYLLFKHMWCNISSQSTALHWWSFNSLYSHGLKEHIPEGSLFRLAEIASRLFWFLCFLIALWKDLFFRLLLLVDPALLSFSTAVINLSVLCWRFAPPSSRRLGSFLFFACRFLLYNIGDTGRFRRGCYSWPLSDSLCASTCCICGTNNHSHLCSVTPNHNKLLRQGLQWVHSMWGIKTERPQCPGRASWVVLSHLLTLSRTRRIFAFFDKVLTRGCPILTARFFVLYFVQVLHCNLWCFRKKISPSRQEPSGSGPMDMSGEYKDYIGRIGYVSYKWWDKNHREDWRIQYGRTYAAEVISLDTVDAVGKVFFSLKWTVWAKPKYATSMRMDAIKIYLDNRLRIRWTCTVGRL
jgi:hypothetical protein